MKIVNVVLHGNFTDGMAYQENCLPYYQKKVFNADVTIISGQYSLKAGSNECEVNEVGEYICQNGLKLIRIPNAKGMLGKRLAYMPSLYTVLENEKPDIIFAHLIQSLSALDIIKYKKSHPEIMVFADSHADHINSAHGWFSSKILHGVIWKFVLKRASSCFEKIYGVLPARVDFLREMYNLPDDKIELLLMGAEDELIDYEHHDLIRNGIRDNLGIELNDFVVITGGKIDNRKNIKVLVDAIELLNDSGIKLIVFGNPDAIMKEYIIEIKQKSFIRYVGWLNQREMYNFFHASDLCVFPGTHSVIWEQTIGYGLPGVFRHWDGIEHIDRFGNIRFFYNNSVSELVSLLKDIIYSNKTFEVMRERANEVKKEFHYSSLALKSLGGNVTRNK